MPSFERYAGWFSGFGLFVAGMVVGAALFMSIYQENLTILHQQKGTLENENKKLTDDLDNLQKFKNKQQYVGKVDVIVDMAEEKQAGTDVNVLNEVKRRVYQDIKVVSGKPVSSVRQAPDVFAGLVDKKVYRNIFEKDYRVTVKHLFVLQTDFILHISYSEITPD